MRHIVLCKLRPGQGAAFDKVAADLRELSPRLLMGGLTSGQNVSPEGLARGYSHGFTIDFETFADLEAYLADPGHQAIGARLVALCEGGVNGLLVVDI